MHVDTCLVAGMCCEWLGQTINKEKKKKAASCDQCEIQYKVFHEVKIIVVC